MTHLLVTNDFPPKVGGIQAYLWELWRRLDPSTFTVLTASSHPGAAAFDAEQEGARDPHRAGAGAACCCPPRPRSPHAGAGHRVGASLVVVDPALPLGLVGPVLGRALRGGAARCRGGGAGPAARGRARRWPPCCAGPGWRSAPAVIPPPRPGGWPAIDMPPVVEVPPGVDLDRLRPLSDEARRKARATWACRPTARWW